MDEVPYALAFSLTLALELPVYTWLLPMVASVSARKAATLAVLVNVASHPVLWFVIIPISERATGTLVAAVVLAETLVVVGEAGSLRLLTDGRFTDLALVSLIANAVSYAAGLILVLPLTV